MGGYLPRKVEPLFSTIWAVTEFTRKNGATQIVPGSHLWKKERQPKPDEIAYAEMKPGSVLFYTGTVLHGGGANQTKDETRVGLFLHYALNWLRQEENQYLSCPPDVAKNLPSELRSMIGYSKGGMCWAFIPTRMTWKRNSSPYRRNICLQNQPEALIAYRTPVNL